MIRYCFITFILFFNLDCLANSLTVLTYHDILPGASENSYATSRSDFVAQMDYLVNNGYQPVSINYLDKVKQGLEILPRKPVLLTFDDGLKSYHDFVVPLLSIYKFPSISSIVTGWLDGKEIPSEYQGKIMSWKQLKMINQSNLVEIISHTHNLHSGIQSTPQGNKDAASVTRQYFPQSRSYESEALFQKRIYQDLQLSADRIKQELGFSPKGIVWPYGYYDDIVSRLAVKAGYEYQFTLKQGPTQLDQLPFVNRIILFGNMTLTDFENELAYNTGFKANKRFVEIQLDAFLDKNYLQQDNLFDSLIDRLETMRVNMVVISPLSADLSKSFFINDEYELGTDILNRTLHLIKAKLPIKFIYLKVPGDQDLIDTDAFYTQLSRLNWFNGILFAGLPEIEELNQIKFIVKQYRPDIQFGALHLTDENASSAFVKVDFVMYKIKANQWNIENSQISKLLDPDQNRTFFLIEDENSEGEELSNTMRTLRHAGVKHFGYSPFDFSTNIKLDTVLDTMLGKELTKPGSGG